MKGLEKSITDNLAAVTVKSAAMQSISFLNNIPTNPWNKYAIFSCRNFKLFTIPSSGAGVSAVSIVNTRDKVITKISPDWGLGHKINDESFKLSTNIS